MRWRVLEVPTAGDPDRTVGAVGPREAGEAVGGGVAVGTAEPADRGAGDRPQLVDDGVGHRGGSTGDVDRGGFESFRLEPCRHRGGIPVDEEHRRHEPGGCGTGGERIGRVPAGRDEEGVGGVSDRPDGSAGLVPGCTEHPDGAVGVLDEIGGPPSRNPVSARLQVIAANNHAATECKSQSRGPELTTLACSTRRSSTAYTGPRESPRQEETSGALMQDAVVGSNP